MVTCFEELRFGCCSTFLSNSLVHSGHQCLQTATLAMPVPRPPTATGLAAFLCMQQCVLRPPHEMKRAYLMARLLGLSFGLIMSVSFEWVNQDRTGKCLAGVFFVTTLTCSSTRAFFTLSVLTHLPHLLSTPFTLSFSLLPLFPLYYETIFPAVVLLCFSIRLCVAAILCAYTLSRTVGSRLV